MKKSVFFFFMILIMTILCVPAFAATGFYAMKLDTDDGVVMAGDFKELDWRGDRPIILVFFQDGVPVQKTDLQLDGLERETDSETEYEDEFTSSIGTYQYANCIVVLDDYEKGQDIGKVYYNGSSVNFKRTEPYCKIFEYDDEDEAWRETKSEEYRLRANEENEEYNANFYDVDNGIWYQEAVNWAANKGIVSGYEEGIFGAQDNVTREQLVTILYNYAKSAGYEVSIGENANILSYNDFEKTSEYAIPALKWAVGAGIMSGNDGYLNPKGDATRAEVASMIQKFCLIGE